MTSLPDLNDPSIRRLVVTGHPNHELAIFGMVQRLRPRLLFLTDGGGAVRENESREGLASIGLSDRARFLSTPEEHLYDALLRRDDLALSRLADAVRQEILAHSIEEIYCESVELYNPLHDITLPIVAAATHDLKGVAIHEFALIAQQPGEGERYRVQRFAPGRPAAALTLRDDELRAKMTAKATIYRTLHGMMKPVLDTVTDEDARTEHYAPASLALPRAGLDHVLRYEWRGELLRSSGAVRDVITFSGHFLPTVQALGVPVTSHPV